MHGTVNSEVEEMAARLLELVTMVDGDVEGGNQEEFKSGVGKRRWKME